MSQSVGGVEVRSTSGAWLTGATIVDYCDNKITVAFDKNADKANEAFDVENVRFAAANVTQDMDVAFSSGDQCELYRAEDQGWFPGTVVNTKGGFYVCEFELNGQLTKDVVDAADLRQPNTNQSLSSQSFTRAVVDVPSDLHDYCANTGSIHADFQRACEAFSCEYTNGQLILLAEKNITKRVEMLREFHMKNLQQKMRLAERMVGLNQTLAENKLMAESHIEKFVVDADLVRFVVGKGGVNIKRARKVEGVMKIDIADNVISIYAKTSEAGKAARQILEFEEEYFLVPRRLVSRIVGQKGKSIQEIIEKSAILKIKILTAEEGRNAQVEGADDPDKTAFKFVGTKDACVNAIALMDYIIKSQQDIDTLLGETGKIEGQIKTYRGGSLASSGYNSEPTSPKANQSQQSKPTKPNQQQRGKQQNNQNGERRPRPQTGNAQRKNERPNNNRQSTSGQPNKQVTVPAMTLDDFIEVKSRKSKKQQQQQQVAA